MRQTVEFREFYAANEEWLRPYAIFSFLRNLFGTAQHWHWGVLARPTPQVLPSPILCTSTASLANPGRTRNCSCRLKINITRRAPCNTYFLSGMSTRRAAHQIAAAFDLYFQSLDGRAVKLG